MAAMRFLMWARRVINTEKAKNAIPPTKSLTLVLARVVGGWAICVEGSEGGGAELERVWSCFGGTLSWVLGSFVSGFEPEPHPMKESIVSREYLDLLRFAETNCQPGVVA